MKQERSTISASLISLLVLVALAGCGKRDTSSSATNEEKKGVAHAASRAAAGQDAGGPKAAASWWDRDPVGPPPAPTVKEGGKGDCSTKYAPRPARDPNPMCKIEGGTFQMGSPEGEGRPEEHPQHRVTLSPFYLDQFEVTNAQYAHFLNAVGSHELCETSTNHRCVRVRPSPKWAEIEKKADGTYAAAAGDEREPVTRASREGAEAYCKWAGKALPTEAQWEYAARHDPKTGRDYRYPWGDAFLPKRAACREEDCHDGFEEVAPVGTFDGTGGFGDGSSPWGVHDMAGNASEWVADCYTRSYVWCKDGCTDPAGPDGAPNCSATLRDPSGDMSNREHLRTAARHGSPWDGGDGLRCARASAHSSNKR